MATRQDRRAGQALPVAGGAGIAVALGPLLGLVALSVGADMLASRQQEAKLEAIKRVVDRLENHEIDKIVAALDSAEHVLEDAMTALLDKLDIPEAVGLGATAAEVRKIQALTLNWLRNWENVAARFAGDKGVDYGKLKNGLAKTAIGGFDAFGLQVQLAYRALALDSRTHMVAMAEATMGGSDQSVEHFQRSIQRRLAQNADHFDRLSRVLRDLASIRLTVGISRGKQSEPGKLRSRFVRLAFALSEAPSPLPMLTADHRLVVEAVRWVDGSVVMLAPRSEAAS